MTTTSRQGRLKETRDLAPYVFSWFERAADVPAWGTTGRLAKLREYALAEPILAGALSSMLSKAASLDWQITGGRNRVRRYQELLAEAEDGRGWNYLLDRWLHDYLVADLGGVLELGRADTANGPVAGLYNLDAECLTLTGNALTPLRYQPKLVGTPLALSALDTARAVDMPSPDERYFGLGFSAVSRALKAAKVLLALYNYEDERLSDMPMPGLVSITGLTMEELEAAFRMYDAKRRSKEQTTFKNVLWFATQMSPVNPIHAELTSFAGLPEGFDKEQTITLYVYTLALDFGVDVREFWPASQTGATKAEAEVQAQKAKGKGFGRLLAAVERALNWDVLPDGLAFAFDQKDSEDDLLRETIREKTIGNVRRLWEPTMLGEGIISITEARRWLVELGMAPDWLAVSPLAQAGSQAPLATQEAVDELADDAVTLAQAADGALAAKARRAGLAAGEDFVAINLAGEVRTLWTARTYHVLPGWGVPAVAPFQVSYP